MSDYNNSSTKAKQKSRRYAMQALYGWLISDNDLKQIETHYLNERNNNKFDVIYFKSLLHQIPEKIKELDEHIEPFSSRKVSDISPIEITILRIATFELLYSSNIPFKVIINEALELAKMFGSDDDSHKFINAILDPLAKKARNL